MRIGEKPSYPQFVWIAYFWVMPTLAAPLVARASFLTAVENVDRLPAHHRLHTSRRRGDPRFVISTWRAREKDGGRRRKHASRKFQSSSIRIRHTGAINNVPTNVTSVTNSTPVLNHSLVSDALDPCTEAELLWGMEHKVLWRAMDVWRKHRPHGLVYSQRDHTCAVQGLTHPIKSSRNRQNRQILSIIHKSGPEQCHSGGEAFQTFRPESFEISGPMRRHGLKRNYGILWPSDARCDRDLCPLVVFLSGVGEHSDYRTYGTENFTLAFETIKKFGLLRYAEHDRACFESLGSVVVFPQLDREENWVAQGKMVLTNFVLPLLKHVQEQRPHTIDTDRIAVMGYSEGAFGALQAAVHFPNVFTVAVAASCSTGMEWWSDLSVPRRSQPKRDNMWNSTAQKPDGWKLRLVIMALGEQDLTGDQPTNLDLGLRWLDRGEATDWAALQVRFYAGLRHKQVWSRLFNHWDSFHDVFWRGRYRVNEIVPGNDFFR